MKYTITTAGKQFEIAFDELPQASQQAIIAYGCQRFVNDRANQGGKDCPQSEKQALAGSVIAQLVEGWVGRTPAPRKSQFAIVAEDMMRKALRGKATKKTLGEEKWAEALAKFSEKFRPAIEKEVALRQAALSVDLGDLFGEDGEDGE